MKDKKFVLASILLCLGLIVLFVSLLLYTGSNNKTLMMTASVGTFVAIASVFWYCIMVVRKKIADKTHHFLSL